MLLAERNAHEFKLAVPAHPRSVGVVRKAFKGLDDLVGSETTQRVSVILSELVTNAIRHAGLRPNHLVEVDVVVGPDGISGVVADPGGGFDPASVPAPDPTGEGGFGLHIVGNLTQRWGVRRGRGRNEVWFELGL